MLAPAINAAIDAAIKGEESLAVHLDGPPCADCLYWRPTLPRDTTGGYRPIVLCHIQNSTVGGLMKPDFSCFIARPEEAKPKRQAEESHTSKHEPHAPVKPNPLKR